MSKNPYWGVMRNAHINNLALNNFVLYWTYSKDNIKCKMANIIYHKKIITIKLYFDILNIHLDDGLIELCRGQKYKNMQLFMSFYI